MVENRRRLHRRALRASRVARGNPVRTRPPTSIALRTRTNLQIRDPAKIETALRRKDHSRHSFPRRRKDVMVYYNDQIMDNLIRAKNRLPFVHVDITLLTSQGGSQISGTIGAGETRTNTNTSKSMAAGALGTIANAVMRPFAYSVTPQ